MDFTPEISTNSTTQSIGGEESLNICLHSIGLLFGLPAHCYVIWLIITGTGSGVTSEFFILNLSVCEIANCLNSLFYILNTFILLSRLATFLLGLAITGRPLFQLLICVERYLAVIYPVTFLKYKPLRYRVICCTAAWIITLGSCFCCMFSLILDNKHAYTWLFLLQFLLFLFIQLFCLVAVLRALKKSGPGERKKEEGNHIKRKVICLILITTLSITLVYVPYIIIGLSFILIQQFIKELFTFSHFCYVLSGFIQPVLYLHRAGNLSCLCFFFNAKSLIVLLSTWICVCLNVIVLYICCVCALKVNEIM